MAQPFGRRKSDRQRPTDWLDVLAPEIMTKYRGKHIAIIYKRIVAAGDSYEYVLEESLRLFPDETPYLAYIQPEEPDEETGEAGD